MAKLNKNGDFNSINKDTMPLDTRVKHEYDNSASSCHSSLRAGIQRDDNLMPKAFRFSQSGRSMVEMLGVLAVIGVLSIGGIMGYSYGMDKYRANEITNDIILRVVDLKAQANNGVEILSLNSWENEQTHYDFNAVGLTDDDLIYMDVGSTNKIPKRVCEIVYDSMADFALQIDINAVRSESKENCTDDNEMTFYFEGQYDYTCDPVCSEGEYCENGTCRPEGKCTLNSSCKDENTYCYITKYDSTCTEHLVGDGVGTCSPVNFREETINGKTYYISGAGLTWWNGLWACEAIGKALNQNIQMLSVDDLFEKKNDTQWITGVSGRTELAIQLHDYISDSWVWTSNLTEDSCGSYNVRVDAGLLGTYSRVNAHSGFLTVCTAK